MITINVKGEIIQDECAWIYKMLGISYATAKEFKEQLEQANGADIQVVVNSVGGNVFEAFEMVEALRGYEGNVEIINVGMAASSASLFVVAGHSKTSPAGMLILHNCSTNADGDYRKMNHASERLQKVNHSIRNLYLEKTKLSEEELIDIMDHETYLTAEEAVEYGFIDEITENTNLPKQKLNPNELMAVTNSISQYAQNHTPKDMMTALMECIGNINDQNVTGKGEKIMTLQEFLNQGEDVKAEFEKEIAARIDDAVKAERKRFHDLDDISASVPKGMLVKAKYENFKDANELALEVLKANAALGTNYLNEAKEDEEESGTEEVEPNPNEGNGDSKKKKEGEETGEELEKEKKEEEETEEEIADKLADIMNRSRKVVK